MSTFTTSMFDSIKESLSKSNTSGFKDVLRFKPGTSCELRLLPNINSPEKTFHHYYTYGWESFATGQYINVVSPQSVGDRCPVTEARYQLRQNGSSEDQALDEEGAGQVENQIANSPEPQTVNEGVDEYKEMIREHILYLHNEGLLGNIAKGLGKVGTAIGKGAKKAGQAIAAGAKDAAGGFKQGYSDQQAQAQQVQAPDVANKPMPAGQLDPDNPTDTELQQYDDNENQKIDGSQQAGDSSEKYRMGHDRIFGDKEAQPAAAGGEQQGMIKKIMGWVKENPNWTKTAAVGILGAASLAMGAALPMIIARYGAGFAAAGGLAGFQKYKELRAQGLEPMEALKQTATDKDVISRAHTGGTVGVGLGTLGDGISKVSSMLSGAGGGGGDAAAQAAQPGAAAQPAQPQMNWDVNGDGIPDATPSWKMAGAPTIKEDILWRPGWVNRTIN